MLFKVRINIEKVTSKFHVANHTIHFENEQQQIFFFARTLNSENPGNGRNTAWNFKVQQGQIRKSIKNIEEIELADEHPSRKLTLNGGSKL